MTPAKARRAARLVVALRRAQLHLLLAEVEHSRNAAAQWRETTKALALKLPMAIQSPAAQAERITQPVLRILAKQGVLGVAELVR